MRRRLRKFLSLDSEGKRLFLEAYLTLGLMRAALLTRPFKKLTRDLRQKGSPGQAVLLTTEEKGLAMAIGESITRAAAHTPWQSACLVQALAARRMLQRRGLPGSFCLGVWRNAEKNKMTAHAWTLCSGEILTGRAGHERFTVVSVFEWERGK